MLNNIKKRDAESVYTYGAFSYCSMNDFCLLLLSSNTVEETI